jgi:hypothetical protein
MAEPFDMDAYDAERTRASMQRIAAGMDRRPKGVVVEGGCCPHAWSRGGYNPHSYLKQPTGRAGGRGEW